MNEMGAYHHTTIYKLRGTTELFGTVRCEEVQTEERSAQRCSERNTEMVGATLVLGKAHGEGAAASIVGFGSNTAYLPTTQ